MSEGALELAGLISRARSVVALTGAGISVPSGIPDFRSPGSGLWENVNPMEVAHIDATVGFPHRRRVLRRHGRALNAEPPVEHVLRRGLVPEQAPERRRSHPPIRPRQRNHGRPRFPLFVVVVADLYNRRDEREKRFDVRRLERLDGIWTPMEIVMINRLQRTRTELIVNTVRYNTGLSEADFTRRVLEQRPQ